MILIYSSLLPCVLLCGVCYLPSMTVNLTRAKDNIDFEEEQLWDGHGMVDDG